MLTDVPPQQSQAELMGQQLFEGQPLLARVHALLEQGQIRIRRRMVNVAQRVDQRRQAQIG